MNYTPGGISGTLGQALIVQVAARAAAAAGPAGPGAEPAPAAGSDPKPATAAASDPQTAPESGDYGTCVPAGKQLHPLRRKAIELALSQVGLVNCLPGPDKAGWERCMEFQEVGFPVLGKPQERLWRPSPKKPFEWCGVFCTWALVKAGVTDKTWRAPRGTKDGLLGAFKVRSDYKGIVPGDVLIHKDFWHHSMCTARSGDDLMIVQGNGINQQITHVKLPSIGKLQGFLHVLDEDYV